MDNLPCDDFVISVFTDLPAGGHIYNNIQGNNNKKTGIFMPFFRQKFSPIPLAKKYSFSPSLVEIALLKF